MRRLGERPANVGFVLRGIADEAAMRRVVAITGASAGIGRAIAIRLARDGASVAICARRRDRLDAVADEILQAGGTSLPIVADVTQRRGHAGVRRADGLALGAARRDDVQRRLRRRTARSTRSRRTRCRR